MKLVIKQPICTDCIACRHFKMDKAEALCRQLRAAGACMIQNSQRVVVVMAKSEMLTDLTQTTLTIPTTIKDDIFPDR